MLLGGGASRGPSLLDALLRLGHLGAIVAAAALGRRGLIVVLAAALEAIVVAARALEGVILVAVRLWAIDAAIAGTLAKGIVKHVDHVSCWKHVVAAALAATGYEPALDQPVQVLVAGGWHSVGSSSANGPS